MGWIGIAPKKILKLAQSWEMQNQNNTEVLPHQIGYSSLKKQEKEEYEKMKTRKEEFGELQFSYLAERDVKYASAVVQFGDSSKAKCRSLPLLETDPGESRTHTNS